MPPQRLSAAARGGPEAARGYPDRSTIADGRVELALAFRIAHGPKPRLSSTPVMVPPTVSGVRCLSACTVRQRDEVPVQRAFRMILQKALLRTQRRRGRRPASHQSTTRPGRLPAYGDEQASAAATRVPRIPAGRTLGLHDASALSPSGGGWLRVVRRSGRGRPRRSVRGGRIPNGARWH